MKNFTGSLVGRPVWLLTLTCISIGYLLAACSAPTQPTYRIGFAQCTGGDDWRRAMQEGMERELSFYPNVTLLTRDAQNNSARQVEQIHDLLRANVDLLIVSPNEAEPITPVVEEAFHRGIPVIIVDRRTTSKLYTAYVGANNTEVGQTAGQYVSDLLKGQGNVLEIKGARGASPTADRHMGFGKTLKPGIRVVAEVSGDWEREYVLKRLPAVLKQHPEVDLIFAHNDRMALGAYQVCKQLGLDQRIKLVGVDGLAGPKGGIQLVEDGILNATVLYSTGGEEAIRTALKILRKEPYEKENILETMVINPTNVHMLKVQSDKILSQQQDIRRQQVLQTEQMKLYKSQKVVLYILVVSLVGAILLGAVAFISLRENREINGRLERQNGEILTQRNQIMDMAEQAREASEAKFRFFTNLSHELRTPLTLILGPIEELMKASLTSAQQRDVRFVRQNALRLLRLVNELIDFRKIEGGKMPIRATEQNMITLLREIMTGFEKPARQRNVSLRMLTAEPELNVWFDAGLLDKVFYNLLSNAFKFTPDGGHITVSVQRLPAENVVRVRVEDSGQGMTDEERRHVFEWFYQGSQQRSSSGSGIGLALAMELVRLHHGDISVSSQPGQGSTFDVRLPLGNAHFAQTETALLPLPLPVAARKPTDEETDIADDSPVENAGKPSGFSVLVIEDHADLRAFVRQKLQPHYQILEAADGNAGLRMAFDTIPDVIVCDVMLPGQSGLEIVSALKNDWRTSHIPVIMLTARQAIEHQLEGVQAGADLYVAKPFHADLLLENIRTLLRNRAYLREHYKRELSVDTTLMSPQRIDRKFVQELAALVEEHHTRTDLSVDELARIMGVSRVQLYRKVKALLNCNVTDYIQNIRLTKARYILLHESVTVADVAYRVGFSSPTYFSTTFKAKYGISPSEFKLGNVAVAD